MVALPFLTPLGGGLAETEPAYAGYEAEDTAPGDAVSQTANHCVKSCIFHSEFLSHETGSQRRFPATDRPSTPTKTGLPSKNE